MIAKAARHDGLPLLAVLYEPRSIPFLALARSGARRRRLLWVVDHGLGIGADVLQTLARLGAVVEIEGSDPVRAAERIAPFAPDGIVCYADNQLVLTARLAEQLGLSHNSTEVAARLTDKHLQRAALEAGGVPVPGHWLVPAAASDAEVDQLAAGMRFPAVLKLRAGTGGQDATPIADAAGLRAALRSATAADADFVVEEFLPDGVVRSEQIVADYVSVESAVAAGEIRHVAVTGCFPLAEPFRETGNFIPSMLGEAEHAAVQDCASAALRALGVTTGVTHTEIKLTPAGPRVIEVNGRVGGDIPDLLRLASGRDMFDISAQLALRQRLPDDVPARCHQVGYILNVQAPVGATSLLAVDGLDEAAKFDEIEAVVLNRRPGQRLDWRDGTYGYVYSALGHAPDHRTMLRRREEILETVRLSFG